MSSTSIPSGQRSARPSGKRSAKRVAGYGLLGGAMVAIAGIGGMKAAGRSVRAHHDRVLDDPLEPPADLVHHHLAGADGAVIHVVDTGGLGTPVVLLHGVTLQWWVWSAVIRLARPNHRVLAWDMRGHGESVAGTDGVTLEACARDLEIVLSELDLTDAVIVGHSMGGMVLGRFALQAPSVLADRVCGVVFLATSGASVSLKGLSGGLVALAGGVAGMARAGMARPRLAYQWKPGDTSAAMVRFAFGAHPTARMIDDVRKMLADMSSQSLAEAGASIAAHDVRRELAAVDVAAVVVVGDQDRLTPRGHAAVLNGQLADSELRVLPGVGHQVMQEAPAAVVAAIERAAELGAERRRTG